ncbi:MAG: TRAP transporter small permease subunit [Hyphomicrobiales bacterium]|nr:TRAP transporter small permease subunit [Hyphomicrobiales bacterium]
MTAFVNVLYTVTRWFGALMLVIMMLVTCVDVFMRYVLLRPILGSNEITQFLLGGVVFAGLALVTGRRQQIVVTLFEPALLRIMPRIYKWLAIVCNFAGIAAIAWLTYKYMKFQYLMQNETEILLWQYGHTALMMTVLAVIGVILGAYALWRPVGGDSDTHTSTE